jgi:hypothetical protein
MFIAAQKNFSGMRIFPFSGKAKWYNTHMKQKLFFGHGISEEAR